MIVRNARKKPQILSLCMLQFSRASASSAKQRTVGFSVVARMSLSVAGLTLCTKLTDCAVQMNRRRRL